ncbi:hypothetical protein KR018_006389 [Drosophila ironensis]|nr:hypothetical protein KR018_006389 [Drosophila ironensis]
MKAFIILLVGVACVLGDIYDECGEKVHATPEQLKRFKNFDFSNDALSPCFIACIFEKLGLFHSEHGFDVHKVHMQLAGANGHVDHSDETHQKIADCANGHKEGDSCAQAYHASMCFKNANLRLLPHSV